jgi:hypothetical protein
MAGLTFLEGLLAFCGIAIGQGLGAECHEGGERIQDILHGGGRFLCWLPLLLPASI